MQEQADELIRSALKGAPAPWPGDASPALSTEVLHRAEFHGVQALVRGDFGAAGWPSDLLEALRRSTLEFAAWELGHRAMLRELLPAMVGAGVEPLLFKGSALAYSLYENPALRHRGDTDLYVDPGDVEAAERVLLAQNFRRESAVSGRFVSYQASFTRRIAEQDHSIDLHWRINNSELLAGLFTHAELRSRARPLPRLHASALAIAPVDALLVGCMHRATHATRPMHHGGKAHFEPGRMIWSMDLHLLAGAFRREDWQDCTSLARKKGLSAICLDGLACAMRDIGTAVPGEVAARLAEPAPGERASAYLRSGLTRQQWLDFRALPGTRARLAFLHESLLPPARYMREKYPNSAAQPLALLYLRRLFGRWRRWV